METVGFVGVGKIGLPISENLIKSGYRVLGYRRSSLADFEKLGGVPAHSPAEIGAQATSCSPACRRRKRSTRWCTARTGFSIRRGAGQIIVELGSHPVPDKQRHVAPLAAKGAAFLDGEVSGTPGMVAARKAVIYLAGDKEAGAKVERVVKRLRRSHASISARSAPPAGSSSSTTCWSPSTSPRPRRRWRSGSRPASTST